MGAAKTVSPGAIKNRLSRLLRVWDKAMQIRYPTQIPAIICPLLNLAKWLQFIDNILLNCSLKTISKGSPASRHPLLI
ncbi:hypothetical protein Xvtf_14930 [Xanthomonas campestris pv. vitistrifoliae]|nr:hypothetical protein Xvtf_14930 [Xanthomonas campestris pv. vitistrifoliae]